MSDSRINYQAVGISLGQAIAVAVSWSVNKSVLWCLLHGLLGWFYVLYYVATR